MHKKQVDMPLHYFVLAIEFLVWVWLTILPGHPLAKFVQDTTSLHRTEFFFFWIWPLVFLSHAMYLIDLSLRQKKEPLWVRLPLWLGFIGFGYAFLYVLVFVGFLFNLAHANG